MNARSSKAFCERIKSQLRFPFLVDGVTVVVGHDKNRVAEELDDEVKIGLQGNGMPERLYSSRHNASESTISIAFNASAAPSPAGPRKANKGSSMTPAAGIIPAKQFRHSDLNVHLKQ